MDTRRMWTNGPIPWISRGQTHGAEPQDVAVRTQKRTTTCCVLALTDASRGVHLRGRLGRPSVVAEPSGPPSPRARRPSGEPGPGDDRSTRCAVLRNVPSRASDRTCRTRETPRSEPSLPATTRCAAIISRPYRPRSERFPQDPGAVAERPEGVERMARAVVPVMTDAQSKKPARRVSPRPAAATVSASSAARTAPASPARGPAA